MLHLPDLTFVLKLYFCYLPSTTLSWFIVCLSGWVSFIYIHWMFIERLCASWPLLHSSISKQGLSALHFSLHWLFHGSCKCSRGFNFHLYMWIPHPAQISPELQIAFHASSPASPPGWTSGTLTSSCDEFPTLSIKAASPQVFPLLRPGTPPSHPKAWERYQFQEVRDFIPHSLLCPQYP